MRAGQAGILSRRGFLAAGAAGVVVIAGGALALRMGRSDAAYRAIAGAGPDPVVLDWKELAIMSLAAEDIISPAAEMPSVHDTMTARRVDLELSYGSDKLQSDMKASLAYLEVLPALSGNFTPFSALSADGRRETLAQMRDTQGTDRAIYLALKFFSGLFYFTDDRTWPLLDYGGPAMPKKYFAAGNRIENVLRNASGGAA